MKHTRKIIAVILMMASLLTMVGIPSWAASDTHEFRYVSTDGFCDFSITFTSKDGEIVSAYSEIELNPNYTSTMIPNKNTYFVVNHELTVMYNHGVNASVLKVLPNYVTNINNLGNTTYHSSKVTALDKYTNIPYFLISFKITDYDNPSTVYYKYSKRVTLAEVLAQ